MNIEQTIEQVKPLYLQGNTTQFNQNRKTFHEIFQLTLNHKSGSRPPKIELTGILIPISKLARRPQCSFNLETDENEYVLRMNETVSALAKQLEWEEVIAKGYLDPDEGIFEVEKISLADTCESHRYYLDALDLNFELDKYKETIARKGRLEVVPDYLAS